MSEEAVRHRESGSPRLRPVDPEIVDRMRERLECRRRDHVMSELGISLNTWNKLLSGQPVRASLQKRILKKFG